MIKYFKKLNSGIKRSLIVGNFIIALIIWLLCEYYDDNEFSEYIAGTTIIYWILVFSGLWIYQGFKKSKNVND